MKVLKIINKYKFVCYSLIFGLSLTSCYYDSEEYLYSEEKCFTSDQSYSNDIKVIIENNCFNCHNEQIPNAGIVLDNYDNLRAIVDNDRLKGVINSENGYKQMPPDAPLPSCEIEKINQWIIDGAKNN